ncbi:hypothetical protein Pcar_3039 [Syntrophotalea carbinolica DSM 2380]|uniref:Uncharacterized protein n=1 Tax=Syntrophotalea carbinolica (strain DSM 2380 / NBRC 103641 / GraBd1) TaxID=338963 RepID=Q3A033_SYNC1|nr:hypothetical protein [Syntrophotalea carbinolica]ABA90274.1 hypothetical protein Pcar_3039 [Syntrophotalea carbinolica DSM 2380]
MAEDQQPQSNGANSLTHIVGKMWRLSASNDELFALLVPISFVFLLILALLGKAAEMGIFAGFSAVCMAFLKLERFSEFSGIGFSAKLRDTVRKVEAMEVKETEVDPEDLSNQPVSEFSWVRISEIERSALQAIEDSPFTFRTATGLAQNLGISVSSVRQLMAGLEDKDMVAQIVTSRRTTAWNITALGRTYLASSPS